MNRQGGAKKYLEVALVHLVVELTMVPKPVMVLPHTFSRVRCFSSFWSHTFWFCGLIRCLCSIFTCSQQEWHFLAMMPVPLLVAMLTNFPPFCISVFTKTWFNVARNSLWNWKSFQAELSGLCSEHIAALAIEFITTGFQGTWPKALGSFSKSLSFFRGGILLGIKWFPSFAFFCYCYRCSVIRGHISDFSAFTFSHLF